MLLLDKHDKRPLEIWSLWMLTCSFQQSCLVLSDEAKEAPPTARSYLVAPIMLDSDKFCKLLPFFCSFWQYECCCHIMKYQCSIVLQKMHSLLDPLCFSSRCLKGSFQVLASQGQKNGVFKRIQGESD